MIKDAVKPLRAPVAWILVGVVFLQFIVGMWRLLQPSGQDGWFFYNAFYGASSFVGLHTAVYLTTAAVVVTLLPDVLPQAKAILWMVICEAGVMLLFGIVSLFAGMFYSPESEYSTISGADKAQQFFDELPSLAITLIPLLVAAAMLRAAELSAKPQQPQGFYAQNMPQQPYPGQGYQGQQPYPQQGYQGSSYPEWGAGPGQQQGGGYGGWPQ